MAEQPEAFDPDRMSYRQVQRKCKDLGLPAAGKGSVLRQSLVDYLLDPAGTLERCRAQKKVKKKKEGWVNWKKHAAKEIMMEDLEPGGWLYEQENENVRTIFSIYQDKQEEFRDVPFDQFEERYLAATKAAVKRRARSAKEEEFLKHDRILYPRQTHNHRGEPNWDLDTEAKEQLRKDVKNKLHTEMPPKMLWQLRKPYRKYKLHIFRPHIYQEIRRVKFCNWLEKKRTKKREKFAKAKVVTFARN